jgi:type I restriction enzyme S subunit
MSFPRYERYKDSGVEWLGEVPEHWDVLALKRQFRIEGGSTPNPSEEHWDGDITWVTPADLSNLNSLYISSSKRSITPTGLVSCGSTMLPLQSIVLSTRAPIGSLAVTQWPLCTNQGCKGLIPFGEVSSHYFAYVLLISKSELNNRGKGTTFLEISGDELSRFEVPSPTFEEQTQIACFLDRETSRIDTLIAEQKRLIALLKEKRQAVISHAVTKGLDSSVLMKDSGVEWLGEVPEHWTIINFQLVVYIAEGQVDPATSPYSEMVLIAPNHIESRTGRILYVETAEEQGADSGKYLCQAGDVVYSKIRPALRKVCIAPEDSLCSADMYPMRGHSGMSNDYLFWFILSEPFSAFALLESDRVAMPKINRDSLGRLKVARPTLSEQVDIAAYLNHETIKIDELIAQANKGVSLLQERRSALISAAVTGKIDLRNWQLTPVPETHKQL